jgi:hypothetical protein
MLQIQVLYEVIQADREREIRERMRKHGVVPTGRPRPTMGHDAESPAYRPVLARKGQPA